MEPVQRIPGVASGAGNRPATAAVGVLTRARGSSSGRWVASTRRTSSRPLGAENGSLPDRGAVFRTPAAPEADRGGTSSGRERNRETCFPRAASLPALVFPGTA
jgi:hypothetical protein